MSRLKKTIYICLCLLCLSLLLPVMLEYHGASGLELPLFSWKAIPFVGSYFSSYLFWLSFALAICVFVALLVLIFYPRTYLEIKLANSDNRLSLKKTALEGFVGSTLASQSYMNNPKVAVALYKKKCQIRVEGEIIPRVNIAEKTKEIKENIEEGLVTFLGLGHSVKMDIVVANIDQQSQKSKQSSRVI